MEGDIPSFNSETEHQHRMRAQRSIIKFCRKCDLCKGLRFWPLSIYKCKDCTFKCHKKCWEKKIRDQETSRNLRGQEQDLTTERWGETEIPDDYETREPSSTDLSETAVRNYTGEDCAPYVGPYTSLIEPYVSPYSPSPAPYVGPNSTSPAPYVSSFDRPSALNASLTERPLLNVASALQLTRTTTQVRTVKITETYTYVTRTTTSLALDADGYRSTSALTSFRTSSTAISSQRSCSSATVCSAGALTSGGVDDYQPRICGYDGTERSAADRELPTIDNNGSTDLAKDQAGKADLTARKVGYVRSKSDVGLGTGKKKSRFTRGNSWAKSAG